MRSNLLTQSRMADGRACARLEHIKYELGIRAISENENIRFGSLLHRGLEAWWKELGDDRLIAALAAVAELEADPYEAVRASVLLTGYHYRWENEPYEVLYIDGKPAVEIAFVTALVNPGTDHPSRTWRRAGKLDVYARYLPTAALHVIEHKSSSEDIGPGSTYWARLRMDAQISMYFDGAEALGFMPDAVVYDVIGKPQLRPLKATPIENRRYTKEGRLYASQREEDETPDEFHSRLTEYVAQFPDDTYRRGEVVRLEKELVEARYDVWQVGEQMREAYARSRWPRNPDACVRYGRLCEFFDVCSGAGSLDDETRFTRLPLVHPELPEFEL